MTTSKLFCLRKGGSPPPPPPLSHYGYISDVQTGQHKDVLTGNCSSSAFSTYFLSMTRLFSLPTDSNFSSHAYTHKHTTSLHTQNTSPGPPHGHMPVNTSNYKQTKWLHALKPAPPLSRHLRLIGTQHWKKGFNILYFCQSPKAS